MPTTGAMRQAVGRAGGMRASDNFPGMEKSRDEGTNLAPIWLYAETIVNQGEGGVRSAARDSCGAPSGSSIASGTRGAVEPSGMDGYGGGGTSPRADRAVLRVYSIDR